MLRSLTAGCGDEVVRNALKPLVLVFGIGEAAKSATFWRVYFAKLADLPAAALIAAVEEFAGLPTAEFFPKPGPLRALALKHAEPIYKAAYRAKRAADSLPRPQRPEESAEQRRQAAEAILSSLSIGGTHVQH